MIYEVPIHWASMPVDQVPCYYESLLGMSKPIIQAWGPTEMSMGGGGIG